MTLRLSTPDDRNIGECRSLKVSGLPGVGGFFLVILLEFSVGRVTAPASLRNLRILLESSHGVSVRIGWGELDGQSTQQIYEFTDHLQIVFLTKVSPSEMAALERIRGGGDLTLGIWLYGECVQDGRAAELRDHSHYTVPQGMWVQALDRMGYQRTLTFEVTVPIEQNDFADTIFGLLIGARAHLAQGKYPECVANCRKAIELLNGDGNELSQKALKLFKGDPKAMTVSERMLALRETARHAMHLSVHHSDLGEYGYKEAKSLLAVTIALISDMSFEITPS